MLVVYFRPLWLFNTLITHWCGGRVRYADDGQRKGKEEMGLNSKCVRFALDGYLGLDQETRTGLYIVTHAFT